MATQPTIKQLEAIYWTGRLGSFQAASRYLNTSQSAIAKRIAELQSLFDQTLIESGNRSANLTDLGHRLMDLAEKVLNANSALMQEMGESAVFRGVFRVAVSELVAISWLPKLLERIRMAYAHAIVEVTVLPAVLALERLKKGECHLALVAGPYWDAGTPAIELQEVEFAWLASPALKVPARTLPVSELEAYPMLVHSPMGVVNQMFLAWCKQYGLRVNQAFSANSLSVTIQMTLAGLGISTLPYRYVLPYVESGALVKIESVPRLPSVRYFAVYQDDWNKAFMREVLQLAREVCDFGAGTSR